MRTLVLGDIHGNDKALLQCLKRSKFNPSEDLLIQLGDVVDGYAHVKQCVNILLRILNLICIKGNHDDWFNKFLQTGLHPQNWHQGGIGTRDSYTSSEGVIFPDSHIDFFRRQIPYYIDDKNRCFVHGGFNRHEPIKGQSEHVLIWDRDLWASAMSFKEMTPIKEGSKYKFKMKDNFSEVFIGHTATLSYMEDIFPFTGEQQRITTPMKAANIWNLDTGCGWPSGKLTIMDVDTNEYWQSDLSGDLYPGEQTR